MIGQALGHYRILEKLGEGGMGVVYRAHDERLDRDVALKVLPERCFSDLTARARLLREARTASKLNHPNICTIHDVGEAGPEGASQAYIAMELVEGQSLSDRLAGGPLPGEEALRYGLQIADALAHAHDRGVIHRDLKSANVVLTPEGRAKVLDFGLAKRLGGGMSADATTQTQATLTEPGAIAGTPAYMAPEQLRGRPADTRSDVWALGVVLYEMAAGGRPFQGETFFQLTAVILTEAPPPLPAQVPVELRAVIERCLEKEPEKRYQRGGEVSAALESIQTGVVAPWVAWRYWLRRRRWLAPAAAVVLLVTVLAGLDVGGLRGWLTGGAASPQIQSLAVLPLANLSGDPGQDYFADGMTEGLITDLSRLGGLKRVIARGSVMRYKGTNRPLAEIARELRVDALITGAVLRSEERVRITVQLINPATGEQLWAERYERHLRDVLALQNEILSSITAQIKVKLTPQEQGLLARARPVNPEAHEAYLKGRIHWFKQTPQDVDTALEYFEQALEKDPNYALAYVGIGYVWIYRGSSLVPAREAYPKFQEIQRKLLELDPTLPEVHEALADGKFYYEWDWATAEREYKRAIELKPNSAEMRIFYWDFLRAMRRPQEARAEIERCLELDPLNSFVQLQYGLFLLSSRRYDEAIAQFQKLIKTESDFPAAQLGLWSAYHYKGMYQEALAEAKAVFARWGDSELAEDLARGSTKGGYPEAMRRAADRLAARSKLTYILPTEMAKLYAYAGEKDRALEWLEKAYQDRESGLVHLQVDPDWDILRDAPRFQDLLRRMRFPE